MNKFLKVTPLSVVSAIAGVVIVALVGSYFSSMNRDWYARLNTPSWQPPSWAFPVAWNIIFILCIVSIILVWNTRPQTGRIYWTIALFALNGVLNVLWSALFFGNRMILPAVYDAGALCLSVIAIMIFAWPISRVGALLLVPYAAWTAFATALTATIYRLNR